MYTTETAPTSQVYGELQQAFAYFNDRLFAGALPTCLITLQRKNRAYGYFSPKRFGALTSDAVTDEIALNPSHFKRGARDVLATLVHEMVHLWQQHFGEPPRRCYHNKEWAKQMHAVGLIPSDTAAPGGKETGQFVSHYIADGGVFDAACASLLADGFALSWGDRAPDADDKPKKAGKRVKYTCPDCGLNVWGKGGIHLLCVECSVELEGDGDGDGEDD